jgi:hypothetical protein
MVPYTLSFGEVDETWLPDVGGKGANLGELTRAGFPSPRRYTTEAQRHGGIPSPGNHHEPSVPHPVLVVHRPQRRGICHIDPEAVVEHRLSLQDDGDSIGAARQSQPSLWHRRDSQKRLVRVCGNAKWQPTLSASRTAAAGSWVSSGGTASMATPTRPTNARSTLAPRKLMQYLLVRGQQQL